MAKALALVAAVLLHFTSGCSPFGSGAFVCQSDQDCLQRGGPGGGRCEAASSFCSFADASCQSGRRYGDYAGDSTKQCVAGEGGADPDAAPDIDAQQPEAGDVCYGDATGLVRACFSTPPTGNVALVGVIDTNGAMCSTIVTGTTACVIAGATIQVPAATTIAVTGPRPLVLVATQTIDVAGTLDAASRHAAASPYATTQTGAGADSILCQPAATMPGNNGGGAGGTFGGPGGSGGRGGGTAPVTQAVTALRGGCRGQNGNSGTPGAGGHGGGAIWLIADTSITIGAGAAINASGEGGHPGVNNNAGGGGGGTGGMIGLDSPTITNNGTVFANAGAGGEGSGVGNSGVAGNEATGAAAAGTSDGGSNGGGAGGAGGANGSAGGNANGTAGVGGTGSGGGGGGGTGVLKVYRGALAGARSPNPS